MEQIDFEELIDLGANLSLINTDKQNESLSQKSSQEPLADVLNQICAAIDANNSVMSDSLKSTVLNFVGSEEMSEAMDENNLELHDSVKCDIDEADDDTVVNLDEFEHILAATYLSNNCADLNETDNVAENNNVTNTVRKGIIERVMPYSLPIDFGEIAETCASLDKVKKTTSFLNSAVELETFAASVNTTDNEIENEYYLETAKLKDVDISFNEDIIHLDEFINDCCFVAEERDNTTERKRSKSVNSDHVNDIVTTNSDLDDSYNSSDFEFISKDEAKKDGILFRTKVTVKNMNTFIHGNTAGSHTAPNNIIKPSTSNPYKNEASLSEYKKYSKYRYQQCYAKLSSEFHVVPEGDQYLDMFRGQFAPVIINNLHVSRNKSVMATTAMAAKFEGLGFSFPENLEEHAEYMEEAAECSKKILSTYPGENRKRRRRF